jgi:hypothetical protein
MSNRLIRPGSPSREEQATMVLTQEWKQYFLAALSGLCADPECENPVETAARIADKATEKVSAHFDALLKRMTEEH